MPAMSASLMRWRWMIVFAVAGLLAMAGAGNSLAAESPRLFQPLVRVENPTPSGIFKVDLKKGYVMYVFPYPKYQVVRVLFYRQRKGRFRVSKGVEYGIGSESGVGEPNAWPDLSAKISGGEVSAHFGPLGFIDMRFVATGGSRRYRPSCGGEAVKFARGHYEGTVRFADGDGHPPVKASMAQIAPAWELEERCTGGIVEGPPTLPGAQLLANSVRPGTPYLTAFKNAPHDHSRIWVFLNEDRRGVSISRFAAVVAPPSAFQYNQALTKATVRPPAPFSGVGVYNQEKDRRRRWSGNLAVDFPGRENVGLTQFPLLAGISPARWSPPHPKNRS